MCACVYALFFVCGVINIQNIINIINNDDDDVDNNNKNRNKSFLAQVAFRGVFFQPIALVEIMGSFFGSICT